MKAKKHTSSYSSDRPIRSENEDLLGRAQFARNLADDIRAWGGNDSLVIGLYGGWGCGKTSLKNLILARLAKKRPLIPVMEFNPWQLSGTGAIASAFFSELGIALRKGKTGAAEAAERADKLNRYAKRLTLGGSTAQAVGTLLSVFGVPGSGLVKEAGTQLKQAGTVAKEGGEALKAETRSMSQLKNELSESLRALKRPLLVVIDDMDRLTTSEIREVLQLVKANADFPNIIYLLLCERNIVSAALNDVSGNRGLEFLEKIIQVGYNVPHISPDAVQKVLFNGLNKFLALPGVSARWDENRWRDLFNNGFSNYFHNLRHVYRFLASLDFHIRVFHRGKHFEVNPIDLFGLEALRVFEPAVYERLAGSKRILTRQESHYIFGEIKQEVVDAAITQILSYAPEERRDKVRQMLQIIFPPVTNGGVGGRYAQDWLRDARVCHSDLFDKYFTLVLPENDLSQAELDHLVGLAKNRNEFVKQCEALQQRGLLKTAFDRMDAFKDEIPTDSLPSLVRALCDIADRFEDADTSRMPFSFSLLDLAYRLVFFGLLRVKDESTRFEILKEAFADSNGLVLPIEIVWMDVRLRAKEGEQNQFLVSELQQITLQESCLEKIRAVVKNGCLQTHPNAKTLLRRWHEWTSGDEVRDWIAQECKTPEAVAWLLSLLMFSVSSNGGVKYYTQLSHVADYGDVEQFEVLAKKVKEAKLPEMQKTGLKEFRRALQRKKEGKPEMDGSRRFDEKD